MKNKIYVYVPGKLKIFRLKEGVDPYKFKIKHPGCIVTTKTPPTIGTMNKWIADGIGRTPDGCKTEPDGYCRHGWPSFLLLKGMI